MTDVQRVSLDHIAVHFAKLEDPRSTVNQRHPLVSVVVIAVMAVLAGAGGPTAIAEWAVQKEEFLIEALNLPNGVPRKDVFRRVLMALNPAAFQACYVDWLNAPAQPRCRGVGRGTADPGSRRQDGAAES